VALLLLLGAYAVAVAVNERLIRYVPKVARLFAPPLFEFSQGVLQGRASPFAIGMSESEARLAAASSGLVRRPCARAPTIGDYNFPAALCFAYPTTGTFWDVWSANGSIVGVRIYTTAVVL
jgi:hypothetical protein